jgi:hypothetical protein
MGAGHRASLYRHSETGMLFQRFLSLAFLTIGLVLISNAHVRAREIPDAAVQDFFDLVKKSGGSRADVPGFPEAYRTMHAQRRLLENAYTGGSGLVFLAVGAFGLVIPAPRREPRRPDAA